MKIKNFYFYLPLLILIGSLMVGCNKQNINPKTPSSKKPISTSILATQTQSPDIRGEIIAIQDTEGRINAIHVEGVLENDTKYDKATARITGETRIFEVKGDSYEVASVGQLVVGSRVEVLFTGMVLEKYPVSADASEIFIIP